MKKFILTVIAACACPLFAQTVPQLVSEALTMSGQGNYTAAVVKFEAAIKLEPANATLHQSLGLTYKNMGDTMRAISALERAVTIAPDLIPSHYNLGLLYEAMALKGGPEGRMWWGKACDSWGRVLSLSKDKAEQELARRHYANAKAFR